ncbi:MAG TPA: methyltransferase domain-containing protein [Acidimicrobiia bacterium]|nr:methyltransferase domain-containing protein [Acidimicrobiia bacterium]
MRIANTDQARAWDGDEGEHWAEHADRYDRSMAPFHQRLMEAAAVAASENVLDIGCGAGQTTRDAARASGSGTALGVDLSSQQLAIARKRAEQQNLGNAEFLQADAQVHQFDRGAFDVMISRAGAMFFADPVAGFTNLANALRPGGRISLIAWQDVDRNSWLTEIFGALALGRDIPTPVPGRPGPLGLALPERSRAILTDAGFSDVEIIDVPGTNRLGDNADDAFGFFRESGIVHGLTEGLDAADKQRALDALYALFVERESAEGVVFPSAAWLITARK